MAESDLQQRLERLGRRLVDEVEQWEQRTRGDRAKAIEAVTHTVGEQVGAVIAAARRSHLEVREQKRLERAKRRAERFEQRRQEASAISGTVQIIVAAVCLAFAVAQPGMWWLIFLALAFGVGGGREISLAASRRKSRKPVEAAQPSQPAHPVDVVCDQLLADLKASPEAVRAFLREPEKTVESLRSTCKALDSRRRQLVAEDAPGQLKALASQRAEIESRRDLATDSEARRKLDDALRSLDGQAAALGQLAAVTERVEGEYTSLLVLLSELKTRVAVAKSTSSDVQLRGLELSVGRLNEELGAISDALETVQRQAPVVAVEETTSETRRGSGSSDKVLA